MNKKYDDFFEDLDKTTDLLKAFKPHLESMNENASSSQDKITEVPSIFTHSFEEQQQDSLNMEIGKSIDEIVQEQEEEIIEKEQQKADLNQIIEMMTETVLEQKEERKQKELKKLEIKKAKEKNKSASFNIFEKCFCTVSALFIIGCIFFYGANIINKDKSANSILSLYNTINKSSSVVYSGDGLYLKKGEFIFKGKNVNNYVRFSNFDWRILKSNEDGTIDLILDDEINILRWGTNNLDYTESDINKYLNEYFINYLDKDYLNKVDICLDRVNNLKSFSCDKVNSDYYVRLITMNEFYESKNDGTFITDIDKIYWTSTSADNKVWVINGLNMGLSGINRMIAVKPVIKLKADINLLSGDGSKDKPYIFSERKTDVVVGDYIKLDNDTYRVYDINDEIYFLVSEDVLPKQATFSSAMSQYNYNDKTSVAYFMNNNYYNSLSYKDLIVPRMLYNGEYKNSYEDVYTSGGMGNVGIYNVADIKFNSSDKEYFLMNNYGSNEILYSAEAKLAKPNSKSYVRATIAIEKQEMKSGNGSKENPFMVR